MSRSSSLHPVGFSPAEISARINVGVVAQHADNVAFLWEQRDAAVDAPHYTLRDLIDLDERVEANLDGLRMAGDVGWRLCEDGLATGEPGETFAAAALAVLSGAPDRTEKVLGVASTDWNRGRAVVSALGWVPFDGAERLIVELTGATESWRRRIGIAAWAVHRRDPGPPLVSALSDRDPDVRGRALRTAGELGRVDLIPRIAHAIADPDDRCS
jgi:uncharacterized protein (TIGR02270 family)